MPNTHRLPGPEFLDSMADQNAASGLDVNAAEFRQRAADWRADHQRMELLEAQVARFERQQRTAAERERAIADLKTHLQAANDSLASATAASAA